MPHHSETESSLTISNSSPKSAEELLDSIKGFDDVCLLRLPAKNGADVSKRLTGVEGLVARTAARLGSGATLITIGDPVDLVHVQAQMPADVQYQLWIAIKRQTPLEYPEQRALPSHHFGALVHTRYSGSLRHSKTRIEYTYCPACEKTTKDYGGKKHTYHHYGTLISDVWRDIAVDFAGDLTAIYKRFADLFGVEPYKELRILDCRELNLVPKSLFTQARAGSSEESSRELQSDLLLGDCLKNLRSIPDNSVDFAFTDPPYNLGKKYTSYADDLEISEYFDWCDQWIDELARVLKPGRTCAILNIPLWAIRHFVKMENVLQYQNWIVWDALSFPVRRIMPAHYAIVCFTKGESRKLPGLSAKSGNFPVQDAKDYYLPLEPLGEGYCLRATCVRNRSQRAQRDRGPLTDLWWDVHRLKHNSRRVDHPCQLPPELLYRLIMVFTEPNELVLDCFNGAGTTTLTADQLGRRYLGIELAEKYQEMTEGRHNEIAQGLDPFRKEKRVLTAKNSPVPRVEKQTYEVTKKTLQLEVRRIAKELGHLPTREEVIAHGEYDIKYYDDYFVSWGEVCAAARTTGMSETRENSRGTKSSAKQLPLL